MTGRVRTFSCAAGALLVSALPLFAQSARQPRVVQVMPAPPARPVVVIAPEQAPVVATEAVPAQAPVMVRPAEVAVVAESPRPVAGQGSVHVAVRPAVAVAVQTPKPAPAPSRRPAQDPPRQFFSSRSAHQGFSVVLVLADITGAEPTAEDNVPPAARRALDDMKDFLPYKSYRLLDAAWLLGQGSQTIRLRGVSGHEYELRLTTPAHGQYARDRLSVHFSLRDAKTQGEAVETALLTETMQRRSSHAERVAQMNRLMQELEAARKKADPAAVRRLERQIASLRAAMAEGDSRMHLASAMVRPIIDTNFTMDVGETVVVGTSRLENNTGALIALLTAVPPRSSSSAKESR